MTSKRHTLHLLWVFPLAVAGGIGRVLGSGVPQNNLTDFRREPVLKSVFDKYGLSDEQRKNITRTIYLEKNGARPEGCAKADENLRKICSEARTAFYEVPEATVQDVANAYISEYVPILR